MKARLGDTGPLIEDVKCPDCGTRMYTTEEDYVCANCRRYRDMPCNDCQHVMQSHMAPHTTVVGECQVAPCDCGKFAFGGSYGTGW